MRNLTFLLIVILLITFPVIGNSASMPIDDVMAQDLVGKFSIGITSDQVVILQKVLAIDSSIYPEGEITGNYGTPTVRAVERFQCKYMDICSGSPDTNGYGLAGPITRAKIKEIMSQNLSDKIIEDTETPKKGDGIKKIIVETKQNPTDSNSTSTEIVLVEMPEKKDFNFSELLGIKKIATVFQNATENINIVSGIQNIIENIHLGTKALVDKLK